MVIEDIRVVSVLALGAQLLSIKGLSTSSSAVELWLCSQLGLDSRSEALALVVGPVRLPLRVAAVCACAVLHVCDYLDLLHVCAGVHIDVVGDLGGTVTGLRRERLFLLALALLALDLLDLVLDLLDLDFRALFYLRVSSLFYF